MRWTYTARGKETQSQRKETGLTVRSTNNGNKMVQSKSNDGVVKGK
jgi:hypothetical protein